MGKKRILNNSMAQIVGKYISKQKCELNDGEIIEIIEELEEIIEMNLELNYLEDIKEDIIQLNIKKDSNLNKIIKKDSIDNQKLEELTIKFLEMLDEQGLVLVLEPNNNVYMDIDYNRLIKVLENNFSLGYARTIINALELIQKIAIVSEEGILNYENYKKLYNNIFASIDIEKSKISYNYMNALLSYVESMGKLYKSK